MLESIITAGELTVSSFLICTAVSMALGVGCALVCMYKNRYSQSFALTLAMLPPMVQVVIMLVNGNIGAGVAVAGAFSLVRFRSANGSAREIGMIFLAMAIGLATGMGYVALAAVFFAVMALYSLLLTGLRFGAGRDSDRELKITIPESMDYDGLFDDIFMRYTVSTRLDKVKTVSMGTLYELVYTVNLKDESDIKAFMDELRTRNGNLGIVCGRPVSKEAL